MREQLLGALKRSTAGLEQERDRQQKRVKQMENERRRLVRAHLEGAIPIDLLKEEQNRITAEMGQAQRQLNATDVDWNVVETNLTLALGLVSDCKQAYRRGGPQVRRRYNQAFWEAIYVDVDGTGYARLADPFSRVLPGEIKDRVENAKTPEHTAVVGGSRKDDLVGAEGLEPPTSAL